VGGSRMNLRQGHAAGWWVRLNPLNTANSEKHECFLSLQPVIEKKLKTFDPHFVVGLGPTFDSVINVSV
jgi:hypothetical protein